ncbi:class I SAM-dependent methyltransferase [Paraburkholderia megapolitana]|uniref:Methyltransferase domain-containing protein n=1 Tax=Paraburkholderia megapolitana TaxID=420953 RepID=A0A1I3N199_9BURK|nr:class I SAM-dependent methyltransferase [Paraburkholderia megapolitana]QDQ84213.1 class I SAM-dependent methyltransferase [Paraburkholderia megapolitana]SFJ03043.1 Methyltransferase domain-containing protein [Paraburkholderia megapolitana]
MSFDSTQRFTDRVADYVKYRPTYPRDVVDFLHGECGVAGDARVADIGAGTGISTKLFLDAGHPVVAVEPNQAMRTAADAWLGSAPSYRSVAGTAEATTLDAGSVDLVIAGQAFHWFNPVTVRDEFARILTTQGRVALFWNSRLLTGSVFLEEYEALLQRYGVGYREVADTYGDDATMVRWFGPRFVGSGCFPNAQQLDFDGLKGRLMSSSYAPKEGHPNHAPLLAALRNLFERTEQHGTIEFRYDTRVYVGRATG